MLKDKVALITGSTSGIGLATARAAVKHGAKVILHGVNRDNLENLPGELKSAPFLEADFATDTGAERLAETAIATFGRIDILVNNAAIYPRVDLAASDGKTFDRIFAVNARSPLLLSRAIVAHMESCKIAGSIVNIGSMNAYCGQPDLLLYSMSKGALMTMSRNIADHCAASGIRVNLLNIGWTLTETEIETQRKEGRPVNWYEELPSVFAPIGRILLPEEVAAHVIFWASPSSAPITGQVYDVEQYPFLGRNAMSRILSQ